MAFTVTGIFSVAEQAQQAVENLIGSGFTRDCIHFSIFNNLDENRYNNIPACTKTNAVTDTVNGSGSSYNNSITGSESDIKRRTADASGRPCIVIICVEIDELARLAAGILEESGSVDIEKQAAEYGFGGEIVFDKYQHRIVN